MRGAHRGVDVCASRAQGVVATLVVVACSLGLAPGALAATTGQISGTVTSASAGKAAISGIEACASSVGGEEFACATTTGSGEYTISGLASGEYYVEFAPPFESHLDYVRQYYNHVSSFAAAQAVLVTAGAARSGVDAELEEGAQITGTVRSAVAGKATIEGIRVCALPSNERYEGVECAKTSATGDYTITGLQGGEYRIEFSSPFESGLDYVTQYYNHQLTRSAAQVVAVIAPLTVSGVDAELEEGGRIAGTVTDASTGSRLAEVLVCASQGSAGTLIGECAFTHSNGEYTISALASGNYKVGFDGAKYQVQYYNGKSSLAAAEVVAVVAPSTTFSIDAALQPTATLPVNTSPPTVSGTAVVGGTLLCADGSWTGTPPPTFTQQWLRDGAPIAGALGSSYVAQAADAGHNVSCLVTAKNARGQKSVSSAGVPVVQPPLSPPARPVITVATSRLVVTHGSTKLRLTCSAATCTGSVEMTVRIVVRSHKGRKVVLGKRTLILAQGSFSLVPGSSVSITLRLTSVGRKRLAHVKRHPIAAKLTVPVHGGSTVTRVVTVS
jgi:Carboxypeptidase regulatory-like domain